MKITQVFDLTDVEKIHEEIFGKEFPKESFYKKSKAYDVLIFKYESNNLDIGYSIVVDQKDIKNFYAWYGGVLPDYQGNGITLKFFDYLKDLAMKKEYKSITVATSNLRPHMLKFAIDYGFDIYDIKKRNSGEGNKIYFIYNISKESIKELALVIDGIYIKPVEIETKIVKAHKNNVKTIKVYGIQNEQTLNYVLRYCNSFVSKPNIILYNQTNVILSNNTKYLIDNYEGDIQIEDVI